MGNEILAKYYEGILNQLRGEVDFINEVFHHQGLKGEGNETALRNLLKKFIPRKYGIGSGIIIDREGTPSRQCDIIIYDNQNYPELLSLTSVHIYPVDFVCATIEVKTSLDSKQARTAIENITSVRSLKFIEDSFRTFPTDAVSEITKDTTLWEENRTIPPIGIVFAYRSNTVNYETFANWFKNKDVEETEYWPSHIFCLDQGVIIAPGWTKRTCYAYPLVYGDIYKTADEIQKINGKEWAVLSGRLIPLSNVKKQKILVDQTKILLHFVTFLSELLAKKHRHISPHISFRENYLTSDLKTVFGVFENEEKPVVVRI